MSDEKRVSIRERFTRMEFIVALFIVVIALIIFSTAIPQALALRDRQSCQENLKTIGEALRMYSIESKRESYPWAKMRDCAGNVQPWSGALELTGFYPEYLTDLDLLVCPSFPAGGSAVEIWDQGKTTNPRWKAVEGFSNNGTVEPCEVLAKPYYYYGWVLSESTFESVRKKRRLEPEDFKRDFVKGGGVHFTEEFGFSVHFPRFRMAVKTLEEKLESGEVDAASPTWNMEYSNGKAIELPMGSTIEFLRTGAERRYCREIGDPAQSPREQGKIVVLHEELFSERDRFYHGGGRTNVLYMDGHVACQTWSHPGMQKFPLNEAGLILMDAVDGTLTYEPEARGVENTM
ncbi:MAG: hypothetical protein HYV27_18620 [Candidatus Hydrogenedentes bacterium]|nr:hypothetical protein [Candidatus Hydrogenedentota bacterium]